MLEIDARERLINYSMHLKQYLLCTPEPKHLRPVVNGKWAPFFFLQRYLVLRYISLLWGVVADRLQLPQRIRGGNENK